MTNQVAATQNGLRIRRIGMDEVRRALALGWRDYRNKPSHIPILGIVYPLLGLLLFWWVLDNALLPLVFPLVSGFALIGPFAALIYYELSRRMEQGETASWQAALNAYRCANISAIAILAVVLAALFVIWILAANAIYGAIMPGAPETIAGFIRMVFGTPEGTQLIVTGCAVGALFAAVVFIISVISFPLLLDREVNAVTAVQASVRAVLANPVPMGIWGVIVVALLVLGALPMLVGLAIVVPVLGHATWHLYRAVVE